MMDDNLFTAAASRSRIEPLAAEIRPPKLDELIGQSHLLAPGTQLRKRIASGRIGSIILYGPPGVGKTTIAMAIGNEMGKAFEVLHPAHNNVADIKRVTEKAREVPMLVFVDEVHRFNATQQDHLLSLTEQGIFDFIGATTENPFFALNKALISRSTIFQLKPLSVEEMEQVVRRAIRHMQTKNIYVQATPETIKMIAGRASGDARRAINVVEGLVAGTPTGQTVAITEEQVEEVYAASPVPYDRSGDAHYDVISAFIKSMRGSDPDATLYWLARLIHAGEDPRFIARRLMIHASEDVGLADNTALATATAALTAVSNIGYPEAQIILAHAALHICLAPKSNSACRGINLALAHVKSQETLQVPPYLRDGHYGGAAKLGVGGYKFPHDAELGWVEQEYAPGIEPGSFYQSDARGGATYEHKASEFWSRVKGKDTPGRF